MLHWSCSLQLKVWVAQFGNEAFSKYLPKFKCAVYLPVGVSLAVSFVVLNVRIIKRLSQGHASSNWSSPIWYKYPLLLDFNTRKIIVCCYLLLTALKAQTIDYNFMLTSWYWISKFSSKPADRSCFNCIIATSLFLLMVKLLMTYSFPVSQ